MSRPKIDSDEKLVLVPIRLKPETLAKVKKVATTREWRTGHTIRKMVEAALAANLVPPAHVLQPAETETQLTN